MADVIDPSLQSYICILSYLKISKIVHAYMAAQFAFHVTNNYPLQLPNSTINGHQFHA